MSTTLTAGPDFDLLPWTSAPEEDRRYRRLLRGTLMLFLLLSLVVPWLPVMQPEPVPVPDPPRPVSGLVLPPPQPVERPEPIPEEPAVATPKAAPTEPERSARQPPAAEEPAPQPAPEPSARERAERSGVLALSDRLQALRSGSPSESLSQNELDSAGADARERERSLAAADVGEGSGGIDSTRIDRETGSQGELAGRSTERVAGPQGSEAGTRSRASRDHRGTRTDEEIQLVFDRNKNGIYALYNRALRNDPTLRGQVVVRLTIAPSGEVTTAKVVSSELRDAELERRLIMRIRQLDFGAKEVESISINYPIDFFPS